MLSIDVDTFLLCLLALLDIWGMKQMNKGNQDEQNATMLRCYESMVLKLSLKTRNSRIKKLLLVARLKRQMEMVLKVMQRTHGSQKSAHCVLDNVVCQLQLHVDICSAGRVLLSGYVARGQNVLFVELRYIHLI